MQKNQIIKLFIFLFLVLTLQSKGQDYLNDINLSKINQSKIREYIQEQKDENIRSFSEIEPSMYPKTSTNGFRSSENIYEIKENINKVWQLYIHTNPSISWSGEKVSFGLLHSTVKEKIAYNGDFVSKIDTGQIIYLNLKILKGIKNLATAFEFINIDKEKRIIEFSYLKGNSSEGKQRIQFFETAKGYTRIVHTSFYHCHDIFKNYLFYSYFHSRITNDFHRNMKKLIENN